MRYRRMYILSISIRAVQTSRRMMHDRLAIQRIWQVVELSESVVFTLAATD